jgi:hypothetical protein
MAVAINTEEKKPWRIAAFFLEKQRRPDINEGT